MKTRKQKKGFTIVELVIVLAVVGVLAAILIPTFTNIINKANVAADTTLVRELNNALAIDSAETGKTHATMTDALKATEKNGFVVQKIKSKTSKNKILWDSVNDVFCYDDGSTTPKYIPDAPRATDSKNYQLWAIDKEVSNKYSTYLYGYEGTTVAAENGYGLDTSSVEGLEKVTYGTTGTAYASDHEVTIVTNGGALDINAPNAVVNHYGEVTTLNIIAVAGSSFHENGKVAFAEIATGRIVLESNSEVKHIHLTATEGNFVDITVAKAANVDMPEFSRDPVDLSTGSKVVVALQDGTAQETDKDYVWLTAVGIYEQVTVSESKTVAGTTYASQTGTDEQKTAAQQIANNITFTDGGVDYKVTATTNNGGTTWTYEVVKEDGSAAPANTFTATEAANTISVSKTGSETSIVPAVENGLDENEKNDVKTTVIQIAEAEEHADTAVLLVGTNYSEYMSFVKFEKMANDPANNGLAGYTAYLQADVDLKNEEWTPIGTKENPFRGKFDGGNHVIRNLKINTETGYAGLFGVVVGSYQNTPKLASDVWDDSNRAMKENGYSENKFTVVVKNLIVDGFSFNSTSGDYHGTIVGYAVDAYFANLTVKNGTISTAGKAGGVIGSTTGSVVFDTLKTESSVSVIATGHTAGGIIAGTNRNYTDNYNGVAFTVAEQNGSHVAIIINCVNNATVSGNTHIGGIVGQPANTTGLQTVIFNCINNGNIYQNGPRTEEPTGGIAGSSTGVTFSVISNCVNNGNIMSTSNYKSNFIGGIVGNGINTKIYSCTNNGNITGCANKVAGIAAELSSSYTEIDLDTCQNTGVIINTNQSGQTYDVYGGNWTEQNFNAYTSIASSVSDIQDKLNNSADAVYYNFTGYDSFEGTLTINKERPSVEIKSDSRICSNIVIEGNRSQNITLNIPNLVCTLYGDMSNVNLIIKGENSSITLAEGASLKNVYVSNGASFTNNGTIFKLQLTDIPTATNNGTIGYMSFVVSENVTTNFTNNGTITEQVRSSGQLHQIVCQGKGTVNFLNNGTINYDYENAPYNCSSYIFLSRSGDSVTLNINCTANSVIDGYQDMNWFCMYKSGNTFTVKYLEEAQFTVNGAIPSTNNYNRLAQNFHKVDSLD